MSLNNKSVEERLLEILTQYVERREPKQIEKHEDEVHTSYERRLNKAQNEHFTIVSSLYNNELHGYQFNVKSKSKMIYTIHIGKTISCTCADHRYRTVHCKHILFILREKIQVDLSSDIYSTLHPNKQLLDQIFSNYRPPL